MSLRVLPAKRFLREAIEELSTTDKKSNPRRGTTNHEWTRMSTNKLIDELSHLQNPAAGRLSGMATKGTKHKL